jgi:DnaJ-domain-containing protein 1
MELPSVAEFELSAGAPGPSAQLVVRPAEPIPVASPASRASPTSQAPQPRPPAAPVSTMAPEQAFKILKVAPSATWEQIEHSRRDLVAKGQPDRLIGIPAEKRKAVQDECRQVNAAYKALLQFKA